MGIESDKLVFDYLSRIGDLAHSTAMTAAERARLVGGMRTEIDRMRSADGGAESKAAVKKILDRLGRPEDVVATANRGGGGDGAVPPPRAYDHHEDTAHAGAGGAGGAGSGSGASGAGDAFGPSVPYGSGGSAGSAGPSVPTQRPRPAAGVGGAPPHLAGADELGPEESDPDWWRVDPSPYGDGATGLGGFDGPGRPHDTQAGGELVPGFIGGIELPEVLKPPPDRSARGAGDAGGAGGAGDKAAPGAKEIPPPVEADPAAAVVEPQRPKPLLRRLLGGGAGTAKGKAAVGPRSGGLIELSAAALLVVGAVTGSLIPLGLGWLAAWWSPRLSRTEAKWGAAGMPGVVVVGAAVWLWGRADGRWGERIPEGGNAMEEAMTGIFPVLLRVAAVASAAFLVWRARRPART